MIIPIMVSIITSAAILLATYTGFTMEYEYKGRHA